MMLQGLSRLAALVGVLFSSGVATAFGQDLSNPVGCAQAGVTCGSALVDQIPGNIATIQQNGNTNTANVEQQAILGAYANAASIQQNGVGDDARVSQKGSQNAAGIAQYGSNETAAVGQNGTNLGVQINQYGNGGSIGVTQFGTGAAGAPPITIKQFK
jgi:curlin associated repeat protein